MIKTVLKYLYFLFNFISLFSYIELAVIFNLGLTQVMKMLKILQN